MKLFKEDLKEVEAFVFDVDGVLSLPYMSVTPQGEMIRTSFSRDGYAIMYCIKKGYPVAVISGGKGPGMRERMERMGVQDIYLGVADKREALRDYVEKRGVALEHIMYMGDDIPDYEVMKLVGMPVCPSDACEEIKSVARYISDIPGGKGCVRDVISQVLKAKGEWMDTSCHVKSM